MLACGLPGAAEDLQLSFRAGLGGFLGSPGGHRNNSDIHLGVELASRLAKGQAFLGLEYRVFRSASYDATQFGAGYALDTAGNLVTGQITPYALGTDGLPKADGRYDSVDIRRDNLEGLTARLGYRIPVWTAGLAAHGGVNLSFLRSQQDVSGGVNVVANRNVATPVVLGMERFYTQFQKSSAVPGLFLGLRYDVNQVFFVETNLNLIGFKEVNYRPFSYTGQAATTELRKSSKATLEISAGMNF
jgi:hypothetical protein